MPETTTNDHRAVLALFGVAAGRGGFPPGRVVVPATVNATTTTGQVAWCTTWSLTDPTSSGQRRAVTTLRQSEAGLSALRTGLDR